MWPLLSSKYYYNTAQLCLSHSLSLPTPRSHAMQCLYLALWQSHEALTLCASIPVYPTTLEVRPTNSTVNGSVADKPCRHTRTIITNPTHLTLLFRQYILFSIIYIKHIHCLQISSLEFCNFLLRQAKLIKSEQCTFAVIHLFLASQTEKLIPTPVASRHPCNVRLSSNSLLLLSPSSFSLRSQNAVCHGDGEEPNRNPSTRNNHPPIASYCYIAGIWCCCVVERIISQ